MTQPLFIPVLAGTTRDGRMSIHAARFVHQVLEKREGVRTELIDIEDLDLHVNTAGGEAADPRFSQAMEACDGLVIVTPEYNHSFPGLLKHVLDTCLKEYIHKAAGVVGVSAGGWGGTRVIENLLPVLRELGLVSIFWDVNVSRVSSTFTEEGELLDEKLTGRTQKFLSELIWMAETLRHGRENITLQEVTT